MFAWPELQTSKARRRPSGDQQGEPAESFPNEVNWTGSLPSARRTQISSLPVRSETKAIRSPSGDIAGLWSARVELIIASRSPKCHDAPEGGIPLPVQRWMLESVQDSLK